MALEVRKGTITAPSTGTTPVRQNVTGLPFQPKAVVFFSAGISTSNTSTQAIIEMFGAMTSATAQFVVANADDGNISTTNAGRVARFGTECICLLSNGTPTIEKLAKFVSFNADGFSIDWTQVSTTTGLIVHYLAIGGTDVTNATIVEVTPNTTTNGVTQAISMGFQPDCVLTCSPAVPSTTAIVDSTISIGAATRLPSTKQYATFWFDNDGATATDAAVYSTTARMGATPSSTAIKDADFSLSSWDASGITINWNDAVATTTQRFYMLALKGGQYDLVNVTAASATGNQNVPVSFQPTGLLMFGSGEITDTDTTASSATTESMYYVGAADSVINQGGVVYNTVDASTRGPFRRNSNTLFWQQITTTNGTSAAAASVTALSASQVTLNWTTANTATRKAAMVVFGSTATAPPTIPPRPTVVPSYAVMRAATR
jgi:hypothetical protein